MTPPADREPVRLSDPPTAEEVKEVLRRYADGSHPKWQVASCQVRIGPLAVNPVETLVVCQDDR